VIPKVVIFHIKFTELLGLLFSRLLVELTMRKVLVLLVLLIFESNGQFCRNSGDENSIILQDCNIQGFKTLMLFFHQAEIQEFLAANSNNFPTVDNKMFQYTPNMKHLVFIGAKVVNIDGDAFANLIFLNVLGLKNNAIKNLKENTFRNLVSLQALTISENQIEAIPARLFEGNRNLLILNLNYNAIREISAGLFDSLKKLEWLTLDHNQIEVIHAQTFRENVNLRKLNLLANKIRAVGEGVFAGTPILYILNLKENSCVNQEYGSMSSVQVVNLKEVYYDLNRCFDNYKNLGRGPTTLTQKPTTQESISTTQIQKQSENTPKPIDTTTLESITTTDIQKQFENTPKPKPEPIDADTEPRAKIQDPITAAPETPIDSTTEQSTITKILTILEQHNLPVIIGSVTSILTVIAVVIKIIVGIKNIRSK
jgi:hypothetical protein